MEIIATMVTNAPAKSKELITLFIVSLVLIVEFYLLVNVSRFAFSRVLTKCAIEVPDRSGTVVIGVT